MSKLKAYCSINEGSGLAGHSESDICGRDFMSSAGQATICDGTLASSHQVSDHTEEREMKPCPRNPGQGYGSMESGGRSPYKRDQLRQLRGRVAYFFMDPFKKFKTRRTIPWKMVLQFLKIIFITWQLVQFGDQRSEIVEFFERNQRALEHLLLKKWDASYETMPYPPAIGAYALYTVDDLMDYIDYAWGQYYNLSRASLATIILLKDNQTGEVQPMTLCNRFNNYDEFDNGTFVVGLGVVSNCTNLIPQTGPRPYDIRTFLLHQNLTIPFTKLLELTLSFQFNTFHLNLIQEQTGPSCYIVNCTIRFKNYERSGQVLIDIQTTSRERQCAGKIVSPDALAEENWNLRTSLAFDGVVIVICLLSTVMCLRSLWQDCRLAMEVSKAYKKLLKKELDFSEQLEFLKLWLLFFILTDLTTVWGSISKIQLELRTVSIVSQNYDMCSVLLGLSGLMAWSGFLRYLSFFKKYNVLLMTLKRAFPNMLRFMVCVVVMYFGFVFCGWVVLGPYNIKFRQLSTASDCLFSMVNGDDMFVTFAATDSSSSTVQYFSRIYLYVFISLFVYCAVSLFISVITDTHDTIKTYHEEGFPKSEVQRFLDLSDDDLHSELSCLGCSHLLTCSLAGCLASCACCETRGCRSCMDKKEEENHLLAPVL